MVAIRRFLANLLALAVAAPALAQAPAVPPRTAAPATAAQATATNRHHGTHWHHRRAAATPTQPGQAQPSRPGQAEAAKPGHPRRHQKHRAARPTAPQAQNKPARPVAAAGAAVPTREKKPAHAAPTSTPAQPVAAATTRLGAADSWTAYASRQGGGAVCFVMGRPQKSEPAGFARKAPTAMVTHRPAEKVANVVSFVAGYPFKEGSAVLLEIGSQRFELFTKGDSAWAATSELDHAIVAALARARQAVVKGTPQRGPATTDLYGLAGFPQALAMIDKACAVKR